MTSNERRKQSIRDNAIYKEYQAHRSTMDIAERYGLSRQRVREIINEEKRMRMLKNTQKDVYALYMAIHSLPIPHHVATRLFNALMRKKIDNLEKLKEHTTEELLKYRNIGEATTKVLYEANLIER